MKCKQCGDTDPGHMMNRGKGRISKVLCKSCHNKNTIERGRRNRQALIEYMGGKCVECGYDKHPDAMDFHHVGAKDKSFKSIRYWSFERAKKELEGCILLCANCHRIEHSGA